MGTALFSLMQRWVVDFQQMVKLFLLVEAFQMVEEFLLIHCQQGPLLEYLLPTMISMQFYNMKTEQ